MNDIKQELDYNFAVALEKYARGEMEYLDMMEVRHEYLYLHGKLRKRD